MSKKLVTNNYKLLAADILRENLGESQNLKNGLYVFAGKPIPQLDEGAILTPDNTSSEIVSTFRQMVFGKRVEQQDIKVVIPNYEWESGAIYDRYSDQDAEIFTKKFFVVQPESENWHVFKCLDNNNNSVSTSPPTFSDTSPEDTYYQTADGYQWKYLYTITKSQYNKFSTPNFIPVIPNPAVAQAAVPGALDVIYVKEKGALYNNYISGQFNSSDIFVNGRNTRFRISDRAVPLNGFYNNCIIAITEGTGKGQYKDILEYSFYGASKEISISSAFDISPDQTSRYSISPKVVVTGAGTENKICVARAIIDPYNSNSVQRVEILDRGSDYRFATASIVTNLVVQPSIEAELVVIIPPKGGHGADVEKELGATRVSISATFANSENGYISTANDYRKIGLINNPLFDSVTIGYTQVPSPTVDPFIISSTPFFGSEQIFQINPHYIRGSVECNTTSGEIIGTVTRFDSEFKAGDPVIIDDEYHMFYGTVQSISNNEHLQLSTNCSFVSSNANIALVEHTATGKVIENSTNSLTLSNVAGKFQPDGYIVGLNSGSSAKIDSVEISGLPTNFSTFNQLIRLDGSIDSVEQFIEDEEVVSLSSDTKGFFHSSETVGVDSKVYLTNVSGIFTPGSVLKGTISNALFTITTKYSGDIVVDSGDILYIENFQPISRANNQSEQIKIIVEF